MKTCGSGTCGSSTCGSSTPAAIASPKSRHCGSSTPAATVVRVTIPLQPLDGLFAAGVLLPQVQPAQVFLPQRSLPQLFVSQALFLHDLRSEEHTSELQSRPHLVCRLL